MLAVSVTPTGTLVGTNWNLLGAPLVLSAGTAAGTNTVDIKLTATGLPGFGNTVTATLTINGAAPATYYNFNSKISFQGDTSDISNVQDNQITLTSAYGVDLFGDTTGGSALLWQVTADYGLSSIAVPDVALSLNGADSLSVKTGAGPSTIGGKIDSPTSAPGLANAKIAYTTNGVVTIDGANPYAGVDTYDLIVGPGLGATASGIVLNGRIDAEHDLSLSDVNSISIAQPITAGNSVAISAVSGGVGGAVTVSQPITATNGPIAITAVAAVVTNAALTATTSTVSLNAGTTLAVNDDVVAKNGITLVGAAGVATSGAADVVSTAGAVTLTSSSGGITTDGTLTGTSGTVALSAKLAAVTKGAITAFTSVTVNTDQDIDVGAPVSVTGATPGAGSLQLSTTSGDVFVRSASPLVVVDGDAAIQASAGSINTRSAITASESVSIRGGQAVDIGAAVSVTGAASGAGVLEVVASAKNVVIQPFSPLTVGDGKVDLEATAGQLEVESRVVSTLAIDLTAAQGVSLSNAVDSSAAIVTTNVGGTITIANASGSVLVDAPLSATGDAISVSSTAGSVDIRDNVTALEGVKFAGDKSLTIGGLLPGAPITVTAFKVGINGTSGSGAVTLTPNLTLALPGDASDLDLTAATTVTVPIAITAGGAVTITSPNGFGVQQPITASNGDITIRSAAGSVTSTLPSAALVANGDISLDGKSGVTVDQTVSSKTGGVTFTSAGGGVTLGPTTTLSVPDVTAGQINIDAGGLLAVGIDLVAGSDITLKSGAAYTATKNLTSTNGDVSMTLTAGGLDVSGIKITAPVGDVLLSAAAGTLTVNTAKILAPVGDITLIDGLGITGLAGPFTAGGSLVVQTGGSWIPTGPFASLTGDIDITATGTIDVSSIAVTAATGSVSLKSTTASVVVGSVASPLTVSPTAGSITLDAATFVTVSQPLTAGGSIAITSVDPLVLGNKLTATNGGITLTSVGLKLVSPGGITTSAVILADGTITYVTPGPIVASAAITSTGAAGAISLTSTATGIATDAPVAAKGNVTYDAPGVITLGKLATSTAGSVSIGGTIAPVGALGISVPISGATGVSLKAGGAVSTITGGTLASVAGPIALTSTGAGISTADTVTATGAVSYDALTTIAVSSAVGGDAGITMTAGGAVSTLAPLTSIAGSVDLASTGGSVSVDSAVLASGSISMKALALVSPASSLTAGADITLTSTGLTPVDGVALGGDLTAGGTITLSAVNIVGNATLGDSIAVKITADVLIVTAGAVASVLFANVGNDVNSLSIVLPSGIDVAFTDVDNLAVTAIATNLGTVTVAAGGALNVTGTIGSPTTVSGITLTAVGAVVVGGGGSLEVGLVDDTGVGNVTVTSIGSDVVIEGSVTAVSGGVTILSGGGTTGAQIGTAGQPGGSIFAANDIVVSGITGVSILGTGSPMVLSAAGNIKLTSPAGAVAVDADIKATSGKITIDAQNNITLSGASMFAGGIFPPTPGAGDILITSVTGTISSSTDISAPANSIMIATAGGVTFSGGSLVTALAYAGGSLPVGLVSIVGSLGIDVVSSPKVTCGRLEINAGSTLPITLNNSGNDVDSLEVRTKGDFTFTQTGPLKIQDPDTTTRSLQVESTGGNVEISCPGGLRVVDGIAWGASGTLSLSGGTGRGVEFVPTSAGDNVGLSFAGTLRDMLGYVNANTARNGSSNAPMQVVFNEPGSPVALAGTITLGTVPLPAIGKVITVDGTLPSGATPGGIVYVNGAGVTGTANGLTLAAGSGGSVIENIGVHGFANAGIEVVTGGNVLRGLVLGASRAGARSANGFGIRVAGVSASALASGNVIGIKAAGDVGNVIVGSKFDGIFIGANAPYTGVYGNRIGELLDGTSLSNDRHGISVQSSIGTVIGSSNPLFANTIAHNKQHGIFVVDVTGSSIAYGVQIVGNTIGDNTVAGVQVRGGGRNLIGGTGITAGNAITGGTYGIRLLPAGITPTHNNVILGNTVAQASADGIRIERSYANSITGNSISGNGNSGILIDSALAGTVRTLANRVQGNTVTGNGSSATNGGIVVSNSSGQVIGQLGGGNILANNTGSGIVVMGTASTGNVVAANDVSGGTFYGIVISSATANAIRRNTSSGNAQSGIAILDSIATVATAENKVTTNTVSGNGVGIQVSGGRYQTIGGLLASEANFVFSNKGDGVLVSSTAVSGPALSVAIRNNRIGVDGSTPASNGGYGVRIQESTSTTVDYANLISNNKLGGICVQGGSATVIGGQATGRGNQIFGNPGNGITIDQPTSGSMPVNVKVAGNSIHNNTGDGIGVMGLRTSGVVIGRAPSITMPNGSGNSITGNGGAGIRVTAAKNVTMIGNSFGSNGGLPIVLAGGGNGGVTPPTITSTTLRLGNQAQPQWDIRGTVSGAPGQRFYVDFYMDVVGGGQGYMGRVLATVGSNGPGSFRVILSSPAGGMGSHTIKATATVATGGTLFGSTSQFTS
jgi:parallel beta-helix repeat protein